MFDNPGYTEGTLVLTGDAKVDRSIRSLAGRKVKVRPWTTQDGKVWLGQLEATVVTVTFNVPADTEVKVQHPLDHAPDDVWLESPIVRSSGLVASIVETPAMQVRAYLASPFTLPYAAWTIIPLDRISFDEDLEFDAANNRIVAKKACRPRVAGRFSSSSTALIAGGMSIAIYKNAAIHSFGNSLQRAFGIGLIELTSQNGPVVCDMVDLAIGDYLELWGYQNFRAAGAAIEDEEAKTYLAAGYESKLAITLPLEIYRDSGTAWSASEVGFKCSVDTSVYPLTVKIMLI